jgi:hypothetical protein
MEVRADGVAVITISNPPVNALSLDGTVPSIPSSPILRARPLLYLTISVSGDRISRPADSNSAAVADLFEIPPGDAFRRRRRSTCCCSFFPNFFGGSLSSSKIDLYGAF